MSTSPNNPPSSLWQLMAPHLGLIALSFALSRLTFELHELLTPYVAYTQGVDLLFLPAGVKLVLIMVAGWRGALGCGLSLLSLSTRFWPGLEPVWLLCYSTLSVGITWLVVSVMLRHMALGPSLEGLSFWELVQIDMLNTLLHGIAVMLIVVRLTAGWGAWLWPLVQMPPSTSPSRSTFSRPRTPAIRCFTSSKLLVGSR